jgi:hypothetical protein
MNEALETLIQIEREHPDAKGLTLIADAILERDSYQERCRYLDRLVSKLLDEINSLRLEYPGGN